MACIVIEVTHPLPVNRGQVGVINPTFRHERSWTSSWQRQWGRPGHGWTSYWRTCARRSLAHVRSTSCLWFLCCDSTDTMLQNQLSLA